MIHPNMATMLGFITTDAAVTPALLDRALRAAVERSFHRVTVDRDTSTNDTILALASGEAGNTLITGDGAAYETFAAALEKICVTLAREMARDGEGATKLVEVTVSGAADEKAAALLAKSVAASSLVKAACFGADANWGRVLCALGYAGPAFDPAAVDVRFASAAGEILVCRSGCSVPFLEETAKRILLEHEVRILVSVGGGKGTATAWGCDLTYDYVKINGDYRT